MPARVEFVQSPNHHPHESQFVNTALFDAVCTLARQKAARGGNHVWFTFADDATTVPPLRFSEHGDAFPTVASLTTVLACGYDNYVAYPSGLVLPIARIPWLWDTLTDVVPRLGTAEQAERFADPDDVFTVPSTHVHGVHVRRDRANGLYQMIAARPFPEWTR